MKRIAELNFDLKQLRSFLEVLNENSFTRASRKLKVGQATISHHISQLEKALGVTLINRAGRDISVTPAGKIFRAFCEKTFTSVDALASDLGKGIPPGVTCIAASTIPAAYLLPKILVAANRECPGAVYRLVVADSRESVEMVKEGRADIGIVGKEYRHSSLSYTPVCRDEIVLVGPRSCPDRVAVADLPRMPFIIREPGSGTRKTCEEELGRHGIAPSVMRVVMECSSTEGIKESIAAGMGVSFISRLAVSREIGLNVLKIIDVSGLSISRSFYFVRTGSKGLTRSGTLILDLLTGFGKGNGFADA
ncbi:MAG: hypothetical protein A2176_05770 [Spirochaetes bacterium RBG_13_51_14]|nr:MAG: hypothetical protein A2176_05770 [Spirochaetes bacterium RBG_13_51_14]